MQARSTILAAVVAVFALALGSEASAASVAEANQTVERFQKTDPGVAKEFRSAEGYAVFPTVGKGGLGIGGAHGSGILYEHGKPVGKASLTQVTIGFQAGGQAFSEVILFRTGESLANFKSGDFAFAADASAVALKAGASASVKYEGGVAVLTSTKGGLMYQAAVGGQKFSFEPFAKRPTG